MTGEGEASDSLGQKPGSNTASSQEISGPTVPKTTLESSGVHGGPQLDCQHSSARGWYHDESLDQVDHDKNLLPTRRVSTVPYVAKHKTVNRLRYDDNGRVLASPMRQSTSDTKYSASFDETAPWDRKSILSLDGGGIRGYSTLLILQELMAHIKLLEGSYRPSPTEDIDPASSSYHPLPPKPANATDTGSPGDKPDPNHEPNDSSSWLPCHYFDYIAGTSTGGLIGIMLGRLRMSVDDCIEHYQELGARVFGHKRWVHVRSPLWWPRDRYSHKALESVVKQVVEEKIPKVPKFPGGHNFAFDENRCRTVVVSYQQQDDEDAERGVETPYLFRTYKNYNRNDRTKEQGTDRNPGPAHDIPIWEVARATSAAPGYFKPPVIQGKEYLDGGFGANNPCAEIYEEVRTMNNHAERCASIILSVGTGKDNGWRRIKKGSGLSRYINLLNVARKWASESEETHDRMLKRVGDVPSIKYYRLNVEHGIGPMKLDEWRARGPIRTKLGSRIGKIKSSRSKDSSKVTSPAPGLNGHARLRGGNIELDPSSDPREACMIPKHFDSNTVLDTQSPGVPCWLRPKNKTLDSIRAHTHEYLRDPEVQEEIQEIASLLVKGRRDRARSDQQRWEKACFGAWYQCKVRGCPKGEYEYGLRSSMEKHLVHKHPELFSNNRRPEIDKALDNCKIIVHSG